jgi:hypothetical protein
MYNTDDELLVNYRPGNLSAEDYKADIEAIIGDGAYHSDEVSETDDEKAQDEINNGIRPKNKDDTDHHVIKVYDKPWRSRRVS